MSKHTYYQPNDYEQMMIAQGWITLADCDPDYQEYIKVAPGVADGDVMDYDTWQNCKRRWDELDVQYDAEIAPFNSPDKCLEMTGQQRSRERELLRDMDWYETLLGY